MKHATLIFAVLILAAPLHAQDNSAAIAASREVSKQLEMMQRAFATIPSVPGGRGLYSQAEGIQVSLFKLRQKINDNAGQEDIVIAFSTLDGQVKQLLDDLKGIDKWDGAVGYVARRMAAAENDLHFALLGPTKAGPGGESQQAQVLYRQTLALATRAEDLESMVRYVYLEQDVLPAWMAATKELRQNIADFQKVQQNKVTKDDLKAAMSKVNKSWEKLIDRFVEVPKFTYYLMQTDALMLDSVLRRVDGLVGIDSRKVRLPVSLLQ